MKTRTNSGGSPAANSGAENEREPKKAAVRVAQVIVGEILRRGLVPGDKLISEEKAVARYGVARGTMREALRFLEFQGVLRIKSGPGGGPIVSRPDAKNLASILTLVLQFADAPFRDIVAARAVMEPGMAALAATNATEKDLTELRVLLGELENCVGQAEAFQNGKRRFHDLIARASGNTVLAYLIPALHWISAESGLTYPPSGHAEVLRGKRALLRALESGDAEAASRQMATLIERSQTDFEKTQGPIMSATVVWGAPRTTTTP